MDASNFNLTTGKDLFTPENTTCSMQEDPVSLTFPPRLEGASPVTQLDSRKVELQPSERSIGTLKHFHTWIKSAEYDFGHTERYNKQLHKHQGETEKCLRSAYYKTNREIEQFYGEPDSQNALLFVQLFSSSSQFKTLNLPYDDLNEILLYATADFMKGCEYFDPAIVFSKIMNAGEKYIRILIKNREFCSKAYCEDKLPLPLLVVLTDYCWDCPVAMMASQCEKLKDVLMADCIPLCMDSLLFSPPPSGTSDCDAHEKLKPEMFMFGEEFEYYTGISIKSETACSNFEKLLLTWKNKLEEKITEQGISQATVKLELLKGKYGESKKFYEKLDIQIGRWHACVFPDMWGDMRLLEVNVSPYKLGQTFKVGDSDYPINELFTKFVTEISDEMNLDISSGHKHVDLRQSIGGNPELLFRMLVDVEDKAWLGKCFKTEDYSDKSRKYVAQGKFGEKASELLDMMTKAFNKAARLGKIGKGGDFFKANKPIRSFWSKLLGNDPDRYIPVNFRLYKDEDNHEARLGHVVSHPSNTAEFRFFNCPRNGDEALLISRLLEAWFVKIAKDQEAGTEIKYTPCDPMARIDSLELKIKYKHFIGSLGLNPSEYEKLLWI